MLSQSQLFSQLCDQFLSLPPFIQVNSTVPLIGRSGLLGDHKNSVFSGVACGRGLMACSTYCITSSGLLCLFNGSRQLEAWVNLKVSDGREHLCAPVRASPSFQNKSTRFDLKQIKCCQTSSASCLAASEDFIFCGCADGVIRVFNPSNLQYIATLHRPHRLGVDLTQSVQHGYKHCGRLEETAASYSHH